MDAFLGRCRHNDPPSIDDFAALYPEFAERIRSEFSALLAVETLKRGMEMSGTRETPVQLGEFRLLREIGRGGMGAVYEAEQESLGRRVALKILPAAVLPDPRRVARFQREAQAAAMLEHPHVVPVHAMGCEGGFHYFAMRLIQGCTVQDVLPEVSRLKSTRHSTDGSPTPLPGRHDTAIALQLLPVLAEAPDASPSGEGRRRTLKTSSSAYFRNVGRIGLEAAEALAYAHSRGVLHRDIKPSNLLLDLEGGAWLADFGLAKIVELGDLTASGEVPGTLRYMAPERFKGVANALSDVYSLGLTLYELVTLRPAFASDDRETLLREILDGDPPRPRQIEPAIPVELESILLKAIDKRPEKRHSSAQELADELRNFVHAEGPLGAPSPAVGSPLRRVRGRRWAVLTVALALCGVAGWMFWRRTPRAAFPVGLEPYQVFAADVDRDGSVDLITANWSSQDLTLLLHGPGASVREAVSFPLPARPRSMACADLDGDAFADLILAHPESKSLSVHLGDGSGGFPRQWSVGLDDRPYSVAAGDLDDDNQLDLVAVGGDRWLWRIAGKGHEGLEKPARQEILAYPQRLVLEQLDTDGYLDAAVTGWDGVQVLQSSGSGTFRAAEALPLGGRSGWNLITVDVDADGLPDLVGTSFDHEHNVVFAEVWVLRNRGAAGFAPAVRFPTPCLADALTAIDLDGDDRPDLAVAGGSPGDVALLRNRGDGTFEPAGTRAAGLRPSWLCGVDWDGDGWEELVVACTGSNEVRVLGVRPTSGQ